MRNLRYIFLLSAMLLWTPVIRGNRAEAADATSSHTLSADTLFARGERAMRQGDYDRALAYFTSLCSRDDGEQLRPLFSKAYQRKGYLLYCKESFAEAMDSYLKARGIAEKHHLTDRLPSLYADIGNVFSATNDLETGIQFYRKALASVKEESHAPVLPVVYNNLLYAYYLKGNPDSVDKYQNLYIKLGGTDARSRYDLLLNGGLLADLLHKDRDAIKRFHQAADFARDSLQSDECVAAANSHIARIYERRQELDSALRYLRLNEAMGRRGNYNNLLVESLRDIARIYDSMGLRTEALQYKSEYLSLSDSIFSRETLNAIKNSQALFESNADAYTIRTLNSTNALQRWWIIALFIVVAVIATLSLSLWQQKKKLSTAYKDLFARNLDLLESERRYADNIDSLENRLNACEKTSDGADPAAAEERKEERRLLINKEQRKELLSRIRHVMESPEFYCDPDCSIDRLAAAIDSNSRYVSEVINEEYGMNFRAFLNKYRIKEAMRRFEDSANYGNLTIRAVAESVGYKSQATFIAVFTKETGLKPSLYQKLACSRGVAGTGKETTSD